MQMAVHYGYSKFFSCPHPLHKSLRMDPNVIQSWKNLEGYIFITA